MACDASQAAIAGGGNVPSAMPDCAIAQAGSTASRQARAAGIAPRVRFRMPSRARWLVGWMVVSLVVIMIGALGSGLRLQARLAAEAAPTGARFHGSSVIPA